MKNYFAWNTAELEWNERGERMGFPKCRSLFDGIEGPSRCSRAEMDIVDLAIVMPPTLYLMAHVSGIGLEGSDAMTECRPC